ncbi:MAG TPA: hypothetical protein PLP33_27720 [Leptospiraceae bacterium]|nr:hypothetical protein [Leptospiraceae bacterium]
MSETEYFKGRGYLEILESPMKVIGNVPTLKVAEETKDWDDETPVPEVTTKGLTVSCSHLTNTEIEIPIGKVSFQSFPYGVVAFFDCACGRPHAVTVS